MEEKELEPTIEDIPPKEEEHEDFDVENVVDAILQSLEHLRLEVERAHARLDELAFTGIAEGKYALLDHVHETKQERRDHAPESQHWYFRKVGD